MYFSNTGVLSKFLLSPAQLRVVPAASSHPREEFPSPTVFATTAAEKNGRARGIFIGKKVPPLFALQREASEKMTIITLL